MHVNGSCFVKFKHLIFELLSACVMCMQGVKSITNG